MESEGCTECVIEEYEIASEPPTCVSYFSHVTEIRISSIAGLSVNLPRFPFNTSWNPDAVTFLDQYSGLLNPFGLFITRSNTVYLVDSSNAEITVYPEGSSVSVRTIQSSLNIFVTANGDVYFNPRYISDVHVWPAIASSSYAVLTTSSYCADIFVDDNNTLYCCMSNDNMIISKYLNDPASPIVTVAGTGTSGSTATMLSAPYGIFVDSQFNLYVADRLNSRIQRFSPGQTSGTSVAGAGSPSTFDIHHPKDVVLDGDGYIFVVEAYYSRIIGSGPSGFFCVAGCDSDGSAPNQLDQPLSMSFDSHGNIWVVDRANTRIQKFLVNNAVLSGEYSHT